MTIYEIVRTEIIDGNSSKPKFKHSVIDSTLDEELAVKIFKSYQKHQTEDESYQIHKIKMHLKMFKW